MGNFEKKLDKANKYFKNKNYKEALKICDKILTKDYNNEKALELEGEILFKLDRIDEAILNWKINSEYNNNPTAKMHLADMDKETKEKALSYDNLNNISSTPEDEIEDIINPNEASKEESPSTSEDTPNAPDKICEEINELKESPAFSEDNIEKSTENINEKKNKEIIEEDNKQNKEETEKLEKEITKKSSVENINEPSGDVSLNTSFINEEENVHENNNNSPNLEENRVNTTNTKEKIKNTKTSLSKGKKSAIIAVCAIIVVAASYAAVKHFNNSSVNNAKQNEIVKEKQLEKDLKANLDKAIKDKDMNAMYTLLTEIPKDKVPSDAKDTYDEATDIMKKDGVKNFYNSGLDSYKDKKYDAALESFSKACKFCDGSYLEPHILYFMGSTYNALDKKDDAVKYFEDYLKKYPHSDLYTAEVLYNLCLYYNDKGDKAQAKKYAQHLEDSYPSSPYYNDTSRKILYS